MYKLCLYLYFVCVYLQNLCPPTIYFENVVQHLLILHVMWLHTMCSNPTFKGIQRWFWENCRNFALRNMNRYRMKQFIKKITILFLILFSFTTHATSQYRETRRLLTDVQDYINEKPDSAIVVLKSYRGLAS